MKLFAMLALGLYALLGHGAEPFREAVRRGLDPLLLPPQGLEGHLAEGFLPAPFQGGVGLGQALGPAGGKEEEEKEPAHALELRPLP